LLQFIRDATAAAVPANGESQAPTYFAQPQLGFVEAAVARLIPTDELGPGAKEAGAAVFINSRLAGGYGRAESWYMQGPWKDGTQEQGYQLKVTPAQLYARRAPPG
jgi:gluconate 2-dehydrogenase gamma chain